MRVTRDLASRLLGGFLRVGDYTIYVNLLRNGRLQVKIVNGSGQVVAGDIVDARALLRLCRPIFALATLKSEEVEALWEVAKGRAPASRRAPRARERGGEEGGEVEELELL